MHLLLAYQLVSSCMFICTKSSLFFNSVLLCKNVLEKKGWQIREVFDSQLMSVRVKFLPLCTLSALHFSCSYTIKGHVICWVCVSRGKCGNRKRHHFPAHLLICFFTKARSLRRGKITGGSRVLSIKQFLLQRFKVCSTVLGRSKSCHSHFTSTVTKI